jgi:hypothetical protein
MSEKMYMEGKINIIIIIIFNVQNKREENFLMRLKLGKNKTIQSLLSNIN